MDPAARREGTSRTLTEAEAAALKVLQRLHAAARFLRKKNLCLFVRATLKGGWGLAIGWDRVETMIGVFFRLDLIDISDEDGRFFRCWD